MNEENHDELIRLCVDKERVVFGFFPRSSFLRLVLFLSLLSSVLLPAPPTNKSRAERGRRRKREREREKKIKNNTDKDTCPVLETKRRKVLLRCGFRFLSPPLPHLLLLLLLLLYLPLLLLLLLLLLSISPNDNGLASRQLSHSLTHGMTPTYPRTHNTTPSLSSSPSHHHRHTDTQHAKTNTT